jgi:hypothetical protein
VDVRGGVLDGGDAGQPRPAAASASLVRPFLLVPGVPGPGVGWGTRGGVRLVVVNSNTLLGPEGTSLGSRVWFGRAAPGGVVGSGRRGGGGVPVGVACAAAAYRFPGWGWVSWGWCGWLFVENCTVDASIFVVKLLRANGGCLGIRSR